MEELGPHACPIRHIPPTSPVSLLKISALAVMEDFYQIFFNYFSSKWTVASLTMSEKVLRLLDQKSVSGSSSLQGACLAHFHLSFIKPVGMEGERALTLQEPEEQSYYPNST